LDLSLYHAQIESVEGRAGRGHTDPRLLISLWLYAYSRGISSARELARQCEFEPGFQWLCGLEAVSHRTLSGFRSENKTALDDLFVQELGMLSVEGLITLERVTLGGTKIKANAGGNTFRRKEKLKVHLELAREQVRILNAEGEQEESTARRQAAARRRAARQSVPFGIIGKRAGQEAGAAALRIAFDWFPAILPGPVETSESAGSGGAGSGASAAREEARSQRVRSTRIQHGPGRTRDEKRRERHGAELQRATAHGYHPRHGGECGSDHGCHRLPSAQNQVWNAA
jgi:transposase